MCEAGFSAVNNIKSKKRNSLTDEHLENFTEAAQQSLSMSLRSVESLQHSRVKFSLTFYDKTARTLVSSKSVELQVS